MLGRKAHTPGCDVTSVPFTKKRTWELPSSTASVLLDRPDHRDHRSRRARSSRRLLTSPHPCALIEKSTVVGSSRTDRCCRCSRTRSRKSARVCGEMKHKPPAVKLLLDLEIPSSYSWHASRSNHRWAGVSLGACYLSLHGAFSMQGQLVEHRGGVSISESTLTNKTKTTGISQNSIRGTSIRNVSRAEQE